MGGVLENNKDVMKISPKYVFKFKNTISLKMLNGTAFHDFIETVFREFAALTLEENESMGQIIPN